MTTEQMVKPVGEQLETPPPVEDLGLPPESIEDPASVFRLALLDERLRRVKLERQLRISVLDTRAVQLQEERKSAIRQLALEESETTTELERARADISKKHKIDLSLYAYDDATGTLKLLSAV